MNVKKVADIILASEKIQVFYFYDEDSKVFLFPDGKFASSNSDETKLKKGRFDYGIGDEDQFQQADKIEEINVLKVPEFIKNFIRTI